MRIVVIGGGIAGLAAAYHLKKRGAAEVVVLERSARPGGKLQTATVAGLPVETGAETFLTTEYGVESVVLGLARELGLPIVHPAPVPAALAVEGTLQPIPPGTLMGIPAEQSTLDKDTGVPLLKAGEDIAVGDLVAPRVGEDVVRRLVDPLLGGVYAGSAHELGLAATMPALHKAAQHQSTLSGAVKAAMAASPRPTGTPIFASVHGGLSRLVTALADGFTVHTGRTVRELQPQRSGWRLVVGSTRDCETVGADAVVLAVPARPAARLLAGVAPVAAELVGVLDYASVALATFALPPQTALPELSGFLVPTGQGLTIKAATFFSRKWPHLAGDGQPVLVRASLGRYGDAQTLQRTDDDLLAIAHADLGTVLGAALPVPLAASLTRWGGGLPQYGVGHVDRIAAAREGLPPTLALAGAAYDGVGIAACVRSGQTAAEQLMQGLGELSA